MKKISKIEVFIVGILLSGSFIFANIAIYTKNRVVFLKSGNLVVIPGDNIIKIAKNLKANGFIESEFFFRLSANHSVEKKDFKILAGEYEIKNGKNFKSFFKDMHDGKTIKRKLTIPEGLESREIEKLINNNEFLSGDPIKIDEEGIVLPETYVFTRGMTRQQMLNSMKKSMKNLLDLLWDKKTNQNKFIKSQMDVVILASIIEKETSEKDERAKVAGVYLNRLEKKMHLGACPTAIYEITRGKYDLGRPLSKKDLKNKGDYNTYTKYGLPIGPICNPGKDSIMAVLNPEKTEALYFVAGNDGKHYFSKNYNDHLNFKNYGLKK